MRLQQSMRHRSSSSPGPTRSGETAQAHLSDLGRQATPDSRGRTYTPDSGSNGKGLSRSSSRIPPIRKHIQQIFGIASATPIVEAKTRAQETRIIDRPIEIRVTEVTSDSKPQLQYTILNYQGTETLESLNGVPRRHGRLLTVEPPGPTKTPRSKGTSRSLSPGFRIRNDCPTVSDEESTSKGSNTPDASVVGDQDYQSSTAVGVGTVLENSTQNPGLESCLMTRARDASPGESLRHQCLSSETNLDLWDRIFESRSNDSNDMSKARVSMIFDPPRPFSAPPASRFGNIPGGRTCTGRDSDHSRGPSRPLQSTNTGPSNAAGNQGQGQGNLNEGSGGRRRPRDSEPFRQRRRAQGHAQDQQRFPCVYHHPGEVDTNPNCRTRKAFVSQLQRHHETHNFFYCKKCWLCNFPRAQVRDRHIEEDLCLVRCIKQSCPNYDQIPQLEGDVEPCTHGKDYSQHEQWKFLFHLARPNDDIPELVGHIPSENVPQQRLPALLPPTRSSESAASLNYVQQAWVRSAPPVGTNDTNVLTDLADIGRRMTQLSEAMNINALSDEALRALHWISQHTRMSLNQIEQICPTLPARNLQRPAETAHTHAAGPHTFSAPFGEAEIADRLISGSQGPSVFGSGAPGSSAPEFGYRVSEPRFDPMSARVTFDDRADDHDWGYQ